MTSVEMWGYEARRCGIAALAVPLVISAGIVAVSIAAANAGAASKDDVGLGTVRLVAMLFPVTAGIAAVAAVGRERMTELQLSLPTPYRRTVRRRLAVVAATSLVAASALILALALKGQWNHPAHGPLAVLVPLGPAVLFIGAGAWAMARLRSVGGASTVVVATWFLQILFLDRLIGVWQLNRLLLAAIGLVLVMRALRRLSASEDLVYGDNE